MAKYLHKHEIDDFIGGPSHKTLVGLGPRLRVLPAKELQVPLEKLDAHLKSVLRLQIREFIHLSPMFHDSHMFDSIYYVDALSARPVDRVGLLHKQPDSLAPSTEPRCRYRTYKGKAQSAPGRR